VPLTTGVNLVPADYLDTCKVENKSSRTIETYEVNIRRYLSVIAPESPNPENTLSYMASLRDKNYSPATIHQVFRTLRTWFNWMVDCGIIDTSPMSKIRLMTLAGVKSTIIKISQFAKIEGKKLGAHTYGIPQPGATL